MVGAQYMPQSMSIGMKGGPCVVHLGHQPHGFGSPGMSAVTFLVK